ncbi:MAG: trypsin-like serine protease [Henriciella sp.]
MRVFLLFLLVLGLGFLGGVIADRMEPSKRLIDQHLKPLIDQVAPPPPAAPEPIALLRLADGATTLAAAELAAYGIDACFPRQAPPPLQDRPWLNRDSNTGGLFDRGALPDAPDLTAHPGLIKIETIRSETGAEREHCAAVRVAEHWFLTAAHCLTSLERGAAKPVYDVIAITPSEDVHSEDTQVVSVTGAVCHAAYGRYRQQYPNDLALFYLADTTGFETVAIAPLETPEHGLIPFDFRRAYIAGWGKNGGTRYLQGTTVTIIEAGEAVLFGERIGPRGPNVGDSGAPLYLAREDGPLVVGTLSQVTQDQHQNGERSMYVRTKAIQDWVTRTIEICEQNGMYACAPNLAASKDAADSQESVADTL